MPDIVLATLNAKYIHAAFGLRYLMANLGRLREHAALAEFDINHRPVDIAESILDQEPRIIGLGVYIWNVAPCTELVALLKRLRPQAIVVLGGPEVSHETEVQPICQAADYVITGEADLAFAELCASLLQGERPAQKVIHALLPDLASLSLPYSLYSEEDVAHRILYVEASRGCPFKCEFCLSSLDAGVRQVPPKALLSSLQDLLDRGATHLKFVDRTFNLHPEASRQILEFLLARSRPGMLYHFEVVPDHLPTSLREIIKAFRPGSLQFEAGVQTFNPQVADRIERRQDPAILEETLRFLRAETGVHVHSDLIAGLPGETLASFAAGFDRLIALRPQEIQVGLLKRLRGTPIGRHDAVWGMLYNPNPPYEILSSSLIDFRTLQRLRRFARYWDLVGNSGNFVDTAPWIWTSPSKPEPARAGAAAPDTAAGSPFHGFLRFSDWLFGQVRRTDSIALPRLMKLLFRYLTEELKLDQSAIAESLWRDHQRAGRREKPGFLLSYLTAPATAAVPAGPTTLPRQARHLA